MFTKTVIATALLASTLQVPIAHAEDVLTGAMAWQVQLMKEPKGGYHCRAYYESTSASAGGKYSIEILLGSEGIFVIHNSGAVISGNDVVFTLEVDPSKKIFLSKRPVYKRFDDKGMHAIIFSMNTPSFTNAFIPDLEMKNAKSITFSVGGRQFYAPVHGFWEVSKRMGECNEKAKAGGV